MDTKVSIILLNKATMDKLLPIIMIERWEGWTWCGHQTSLQ